MRMLSRKGETQKGRRGMVRRHTWNYMKGKTSEYIKVEKKGEN